MPKPLSIALATCKEWPHPGAGLLAVIHALELDGHSVGVLPWQEDNRAFVEADLILPLAIWDYAKQPDCFRNWLLEIEDAGGVFANCPKLMAWNSDKRYLLDLEQKGVHVPKTVPVESAEQVYFAMQQHEWAQAVIKPAIGQSGHGVRLLRAPLEDGLALDKPHILQDWIPEIKQGELSMIFFNGQFSHAVTRMPAKEDWRANSQYGVTVTQATAPFGAINAGQTCLENLSSMPLYGRVDGLMMPGGEFLLTELELIEPALFLDVVPGSAARLADAIRDCVKNC